MEKTYNIDSSRKPLHCALLEDHAIPGLDIEDNIFGVFASNNNGETYLACKAAISSYMLAAGTSYPVYYLQRYLAGPNGRHSLSCIPPSAASGDPPEAWETIAGSPPGAFIAMNEPPTAPAMRARSVDDDTAERGDLELDVAFALEPLDEALDVAFLAIRGAQQAIRSIPDTGTADRVRNEWRTNNVLVRQALRLVDERVQELAKAVRRLPRVG